MLPYDDFRSLPLLFHLNSEPWLNQEAYTDPTSVPEFRPVADPDAAIPLPDVAPASALDALLRRRRSCRAFEARPMSLATVALLLQRAYGVHEAVLRENGLLALTRPAPSAGGLYPLTLRIAAARVEGLADGVFAYNPLHRCLEPVPAAGAIAELGAHLLAQHFLQHANLLVSLCATFERTTQKYGSRGYRYVLLEAGHVAQNLCLAAAEQGLGSLCVGGYRDRGLNRFLGIDGRAEAVVYCVGVGHPAGVQEDAETPSPKVKGPK